MIEYLKLENVGLAPTFEVEWAPRFNIITGDNGLGKSFLLDLAWWALTRTWAGNLATPSLREGKAVIQYKVSGNAGPVSSAYDRASSVWPLPRGRPTKQGIVVYVRIDGGFSVWDPARNYWRSDPGRPDAYHFDAAQVWDGLEMAGKSVCEGLERDWVSWQTSNASEFKALEEVMQVLSPTGETLKAGKPERVFLGEGRVRPTLEIGSQTVPLVFASAGVRRVLALAYFLVWAWSEHGAAAKLLQKDPDDRFVILFDEPETHLHPRWQRTILTSVLKAIDALRDKKGEKPQILVATHSPLILASLEPHFDEDIDDLIHLRLDKGAVRIEQDIWTKQGDVTNWLVSEVFGLEQARSPEAEVAIEAAEAFMRGDSHLPKGLLTRREINAALQKLLGDHDPFWPRWLVHTKGRDLKL